MKEKMTNLDKLTLANSLSDLKSYIMREDYASILDESGLDWIWEENTEELYKSLSLESDIVHALKTDEFIRVENMVIDGKMKKVLIGSSNHYEEYASVVDALIDYLTGVIELSDSELFHDGYVTPTEYMNDAEELMFMVESILDDVIQKLIESGKCKEDIGNIINSHDCNVRDRILFLINDNFEELEEFVTIEEY